MATDSDTIESPLISLGRDECVALLRQGSIGRLAVVIGAQPHIFPLNYAADEEGVIVFRTAELTAATEVSLARVAFEIDAIDVERHRGWSVAVHGYAREIGDAIDRDSERLRRLPVQPWASGRRDRWFKIAPTEITGRRLTRTASAS